MCNALQTASSEFMKRLLYLLCVLICSCGQERLVKLPEIPKAEISEVFDVSPAYIFYDETQKDSVLFNRKNLISTTNWLVNVDKRIKLKQTLPHLQFLQNKRQKKGMHSNEKARNYFSCNDLSKNNLGFIDFTAIRFYGNQDLDTQAQLPDFCLKVYDPDRLEFIIKNSEPITTGIADLAQVLLKQIKTYDHKLEISTFYNEDLLFQDYISVKAALVSLGEIPELQLGEDFFVNLNLLN